MLHCHIVLTQSIYSTPGPTGRLHGESDDGDVPESGRDEGHRDSEPGRGHQAALSITRLVRRVLVRELWSW